MRSVLLPLLLFTLVSLFSSHARASESAPPPQGGTHMRSIPLFVTGVVFDVAGGAATAGGIGLLAAGASSCHRDTDAGCATAGTLISLAGVVAIVGGSALLAIGIPLTVVGATAVPDAKASRSSPRVRLGGSGLALTF
ncbi:MAG: hypothetical protein JWP87_3980 [Labilithrix sp.]|nr:hypothetical protein [Labilithrix sp.]